MRLSNKELAEAVRKARQSGWIITMTRKGHYRFTKGAQMIMTGHDPKATGRGWKNFRAQARRAGLEL